LCGARGAPMVSIVPGGVREAKKRETRRALADAAITLATDRGLNGFTVEEIALAAGVSTRTFFNYFRSKEEALGGLDPDELAAFTAELADRPAEEGPLEALAAILVPDGVGADVALYARRQVLFERYAELRPQQLANERRIDEALTATMAARMDASPSDPYPRILVFATMAALRAAATWYGEVRPDLPVEQVLRGVVEQVGAGLDVRA
jgi:AcrR family transcriptional regulator